MSRKIPEKTFPKQGTLVPLRGGPCAGQLVPFSSVSALVPYVLKQEAEIVGPDDPWRLFSPVFVRYAIYTWKVDKDGCVYGAYNKKATEQQEEEERWSPISSAIEGIIEDLDSIEEWVDSLEHNMREMGYEIQ